LYTWPFLATYPAFFSIYFPSASYEKYLGSQEWTVLYFGTILSVQALIWLGCHWSIGWKAWITGIKVWGSTTESRNRLLTCAALA